jgi:hypothetical protein
VYEDEFDLFDALLALHMEWDAILAEYRRHSARLVRDELASGRLSPSGARGVIADLSTHITAAEQLSQCVDALEAVVARAEEARVTRGYQLRRASTAQAAQGDDAPDTSTRPPGGAGPAERSESGQRKETERH